MNRISHHRLRVPINQRQFAFFLGIKPSTLANYENGVRKPSIDIGWKIVEGFKLKGLDVTFESVFPNPKEDLELAS